MKASVIDLRYKMANVLKALDRREKVEVLYHGKVKGIIVPVTEEKQKGAMKDHPFFGMCKDSEKTVDEVMHELRGGRYHGL